MYQAEGISITAGDYGMASGLGDPPELADRAMPDTAAHGGARSRVLVVDDEPEIVAYLREASDRPARQSALVNWHAFDEMADSLTQREHAWLDEKLEETCA